MLKMLLAFILSLSCQSAFTQTFIKGNALIEGITSTATAAGTTTLTKDSQTNQIFTGVTTQTVVLPDATTLPVGRRFYVSNQSTGVVTLNANGGGLIKTIGSLAATEVRLITNGTAAGTWDVYDGNSPSTNFTLGSVIFAGTGGVFSQSNSNFFWDTTNNRLGLGTTAPTTLLTVGNTTVNRYFTATTSGSPTSRNDNNGNQTTLTLENRDLQASTHSADVLVNFGRTGSSTAIEAGRLRWLTDQEWTSTASTQDSSLLFFLTLDSASSEKMRLTSGGLLGIGLTPVAKIHADSGNATASAIKLTAGTTTGTTSTDGVNFGITSAGIGEIRQYENLDFNFYTNNTNRMTIASTGAVGVGTQAPVAVDMAGGPVTPNFQVLGLSAAESSGSLARFTNTSSAGRFVMAKSRGATIGSYTAVSALDNLGTVAFEGADGTDFADSVNILGQVDAAVSNNIVPGRLVVKTANSSGTLTEHLRMASNGRLSLSEGALTAAAKVHIDSGDATASAIKITAGTTTGTGGTDGLNLGITTAGVGELRQYENLDFNFYTNNTQRARIPAAGGLVVGDNSAALSTSATDGFLYIPTSAGPPVGTPSAQTGSAPIEIDTTNNALYYYSGAAWRTPLTNPMTTGGDIIYGGASGVPTRLANGSANQVLVSSGGTSAPTWSFSPQIGAVAHDCTTGISGTWTTLVFPTEDSDAQSSYDNSTGIYTVPTGAGGIYDINAQVGVTGTYVLNSLIEMRVYKNNTTEIAYNFFYAGGAITSTKMKISASVVLAAGDTVRIQLQTSVTSPSIINYAPGNLVSFMRH